MNVDINGHILKRKEDNIVYSHCPKKSERLYQSLSLNIR